LKVELCRIPSSELSSLFSQYDRFFYWNPSQRNLIECAQGQWQPPIVVEDLLEHLTRGHIGAPVMIDGLIEYEVNLRVAHYIVNADLHQLNQHWIFLSRIHVELPVDLLPFVAEKNWHLPTVKEISEYLMTRGVYSDRLVRVASGLYFGELRKLLDNCVSGEELSVVGAYKARKLKQKGILHIPKPDVEVAGVENITAIIEEAADMLLPAAKEAGLPFLKGSVFIGPPGTGKSLAAKAAATKMDVPLICVDWAGLISDRPGQSEDNIKSVIELAEALAPSIIFFDDFDKAFSSADLSRENAVEKRIAGYLLTWIQERTADVYTIVTCNRVEQIPPELKRRFTDIIFVDLPHEGGRYEIFKVHLDRYMINYSNWSREEWGQVIREYNECTPDELARAVDRAVRNKFRTESTVQITYQDLLTARTQFTPSNIASNTQIENIRANSVVYPKAASQDNSIYKVEARPEFKAMMGRKS
jgi:hypothetical protein